jgi:oxygen-independent coproporphyrinogen-3 oxidase
MAGIYVHIPFCRRRCGYCDFYSCTDVGLLDRVVEAIGGELTRQREWLGDARIETLYFGGGTPSLCSPGQLQGIVERVRGLWDCDLREVTVEANPDDLTEEYAARLAATDVNRLSIGVQTFIDRDLRIMNRRHTARRAVEAVAAAQHAGFDNVTIDLIYGIPGMSAAEWRANIERALGLGVQHISAYHLTIEPGTPFAALRPVDDAVSQEQFLVLHRMLTDAGYEHYEVSNFALAGRRARHNAAYWSGQPYLGVGPGAHSYDGRARRSFPWPVGDYLAGRDYAVEVLTPADRHNELIMTRLRTAEGIDGAELERLFGREALDRFARGAARFVAQGLLLHDGDRWRIPPEKFLLSDVVIGGLFV